MLLNNGQHIDQNTPNTNKHCIGRYTVLVIFNRFYYNVRQNSKESLIGILQ